MVLAKGRISLDSSWPSAVGLVNSVPVVVASETNVKCIHSLELPVLVVKELSW